MGECGQYGIMKLEQGEVMVREGLIKMPSSPEEPPRIIASKCTKCGDIALPKKRICGVCDGTELEDVLLSNRGKIYSYTIVRQAIPGYDVPYIVGVIQVPEDEAIPIIAQLRECELDEVKVDMEVEMIVDVLNVNFRGEKVIGYVYRPVKEN